MTKPRKRRQPGYSDSGSPIMTPPASPKQAPAPSGSRLPAPQADTSWPRIQTSLRLRFNPIQKLSPRILTHYLDQFRLGFFRQTALAWDAMERRDTRLQTVAPKRKKSVARLDWEILAVDESPEALRQKQVLEYFYNQLTATTALEPDERGGMGLLVRQMMDAVGKRYAVHEITWQPGPGGLTAQFTFCPLWWFEGTRGKLRYLANEMAIYGEDLEPWGWLVTVGDGIMEACSVAYMYKHMPLKDWVSFSEKFGFPGIVGETRAARDSQEWKDMEDAMAKFSNDWSAVFRQGKIALVETKNQGDQPFKPLVDMMNEEMTRLWRGSDLSTSSKMHALGATLQRDESTILEQDDAQMIGETLNAQVSRFVLQYHFGDGPALAYLRLATPEPQTVAHDIAVDQFLLAAGAPVAVRDALERYHRPQPDAGEELLHAPVTPVNTRSAALGEGVDEPETGTQAS
jgi:phage gp29-like protein